MSRFLQYRDGGKTDERGISSHLTGLFVDEVIKGFSATQSSPLGLAVSVAKGKAFIPTGNDYPYVVYTDSNENVAVTTADGSNPRIDVLVAYVDKGEVSSVNPNNPTSFKFAVVAGVPAGSPTPTTDMAIQSFIGLGNPYIKLAQVRVNAAAPNITNGNITDIRTMASLGLGLVKTAAIDDGAVTPSKLATGAVSSGVAGSTTSALQTYQTFSDATKVTVDIGINGLALVVVQAYVQNNAANSLTFISYVVSGASTVAAADVKSMSYQNYAANSLSQQSYTHLATGLSAGSTTFTLAARCSGNLSTYNNRQITVIPL